MGEKGKFDGGVFSARLDTEETGPETASEVSLEPGSSSGALSDTVLVELPPPDERSLEEVEGIGPHFAAALIAAGVTNLGTLSRLELDAEGPPLTPGLTARRVLPWVHQARSLVAHAQLIDGNDAEVIYLVFGEAPDARLSTLSPGEIEAHVEEARERIKLPADYHPTRIVALGRKLDQDQA